VTQTFPGFIDGPAGRLQIQVDLPKVAPRAFGVLCHPHTLHGGTLRNKVIHQAARAFVTAGAAAVRFNFRGAGKSSGVCDYGKGEVDDLAAVVAWARSQWPERPFWLAGFSFGAYVSLRAAAAQAPVMLVSIAPPVGRYSFDEIDLPQSRWLIVQGRNDEVVPTAAVSAWVRTLPNQPRYVIVEDAGHFFHGRLAPLREQIIAFARTP
jgi:alpha/beta superfamily hydrolase